MDPVRLIVTALAAGTALGRHGASGTRPQDAYASLWARVRKRLASRPDAAMVLARHAEAPHTWEAPLIAELAAAGAGQDADLIAAATALLSLTDEVGFRSGEYAADPQSSPGALIGDQAAQRNSLNGQLGH
jgi:hypothetical protein